MDLAHLLTLFMAGHPESIAPKFKRAMEKLAVIGQDANSLVDCSEVIPEPEAFEVPLPHLPAGKSLEDIEASVRWHWLMIISWNSDRPLIFNSVLTSSFRTSRLILVSGSLCVQLHKAIHAMRRQVLVRQFLRLHSTSCKGYPIYLPTYDYFCSIENDRLPIQSN